MNLINILKRYFKYLTFFGPRITFYYLTYPRFGGSKAISKRHYEIKRFIKRKYKSVFELYKNINIEEEPSYKENLPIWVCWLQGEENMPEIINICYKSIKRHSNGKTVNLITYQNLEYFVTIPSFIKKYVQEGKISRTHYADYIRILLLEKYGGLWLDASVFVTDDITTEMEQPFYSVKQKEIGSIHFVSEYRWTVSLLGCSGNGGKQMFSCLNTLFKSYLKKHTLFIDFFLFDYFIATIYEEIPAFRKFIDSNEYNCENFYQLQDNLNDTYDKRIFQQIKENSKFHKTSWKQVYRVVDENKNPTLYGYLKNEI